MIKFNHDKVVIEEPAPGHFLIRGHAPRPVFVEGEGHVVPPETCYVAPEVPSEALLAILEARGDMEPFAPGTVESSEVEPELTEEEIADIEGASQKEETANEPKRRGRPRKN